MSADLPDLLDLWRELRALTGPVDRALPVPSESGVRQRLQEVAGEPDARLLVATRDDAIVGMALLTLTPIGPFAEGRAVHVHYLHVRAAVRRSGVGRALMVAVTSHAEECGADVVVTSVAPALRDANRFYARLGLAPMVLRRVAPVATLRRSLHLDVRASADPLLRRRRSLRSRARLGAAMAASTPR